MSYDMSFDTFLFLFFFIKFDSKHVILVKTTPKCTFYLNKTVLFWRLGLI